LLYLHLRDADAGIGKIADRIYWSIGYSPSPCLVQRFFASCIRSPETPAAEMEFQQNAERERLAEALTDLYMAASLLTRIRRWEIWGIEEKFQTSIIFADEFYELRATEEGREVFAYFVKLGLFYGTEAQTVRTVALNTGNGALAEEVKDIARIRLEDQPNPSEQAVRKALEAKGFSVESIEKIMKMCGVRLRLLHPFLSAEADQVEKKAQPSFVQRTLEIHLKAALNVVKGLMRRKAPTSADFSGMVTAMDKLAAADGFLPDPVMVPEPYRIPFPKAVLSCDSEACVFLQSEAVRQAWRQYKAEVKAEVKPEVKAKRKDQNSSGNGTKSTAFAKPKGE
jgi:hypothetical protein